MRQNRATRQEVPGDPLLVVARRTWLADDVVTHVKLHYPSHAHQLKAVFAPGTQQTI